MDLSISDMPSEAMDAVAALAGACGQQGWARRADIEAESARSYAWILTAIAADATVVGYLVAWTVVDQTELLSIGVERRHRRRGIARQLMLHLLKRSRELGAQTVFLEVRQDNEAARCLYEGCGFTSVDVREGYYRDGADALVMRAAVIPTTPMPSTASG